MTTQVLRVSMPLRAFLLFGQAGYIDTLTGPDEGFNALAGIFAFRTLDLNTGAIQVRNVSMPLRAFLLFGLL